MAKKTTSKEEPLEKQLWKAADKLRKNINAAEYKHVVLGLIFLKYISDSFEELYDKLQAGEGEYAGADPEDRDEYKAENVFFVPETARWSYLQANATQPTIGKTVDDAMDAVEKESPSLKGVLPKVYARQNLDPTSLGGIINLIGNIALGDAKARSADVLGHVFEYFLGQFALAEGKKGGQFYTPRSVVELLVEMLEPYKGRVFDPCCGSGGMFVQSEKFVKERQGRINDISIYGQESNLDTWRLAKMNLAIRGIDSSQVKWNKEGSFFNDAHKDLKADYVIANPPFNDGDWGGELLRTDGRWQFGIPPISNANFGWIQHFIYHLSVSGKAGFILANSSLSSNNSEEEKVRKAIVENNMLECIVSLPALLFSNTQIAVCMWFLSRKSDTRDEVLFIDASKLGTIIKRKDRVLKPNDLEKIYSTFRSWKGGDKISVYEDVNGFCYSASMEEIRNNDFNLSPKRYITPLEQEVKIKVDLNSPKLISKLTNVKNALENNINQVLKSVSNDESVKFQNVIQINKISEQLNKLGNSIYEALINRYFIELPDVNPPKKWRLKRFGELFDESKDKVKDIGYCPPVFSVTNLGIQPREGKFTKELSKSSENYKIAYKGDMVFGLSREIPNFDVLKEEIGAFSPAYSVFRPDDYRIGLIVGAIMRLKLMEQTDLLKGGAREGRGLDKDKLLSKEFLLPDQESIDELWQSKIEAYV